MTREPWFLAAERWADKVARREQDETHVSELTFALEASTWFNRREVAADDCA